MNTNVIKLVKPRVSKLTKIDDPHAEITKIAKRLYEQGGHRDGYELDDWFEAEAIFKMKSAINKKNLKS